MTPTNVRIFEVLAVGPLSVNCYLVGSDATRAAVCIDPGDEAGLILEAIDRHGLHLDAVILTHTHFDHVGAVADVAREHDAPVMAPGAEEQMLAMAPDLARMWGFDAVEVPHVSRWLSPGDVVEGGGFALGVLDLAGHSPGGLGFLADGDVFTGDALFAGSVGRTDVPGADHSTLIDAIRRNLLTLVSDTRVHPGHGPSSTVGDEARSNPFLTV